MTWTAILKAVVGLVGLLRDFFSMRKSAEDRQAGRDEVLADQARQKDERLKEAMQAEVEADKAHKTLPGDEALDRDFRRD